MARGLIQLMCRASIPSIGQCTFRKTRVRSEPPLTCLIFLRDHKNPVQLTLLPFFAFPRQVLSISIVLHDH